MFKNIITFIVVAVCSFISMGASADNYDSKEKLYAVADARIQFRYNHARAPSWLTQEDAIAALKRAAEKWAVCGITIEYIGTTDANPAEKDSQSTIGWSPFLQYQGFSEMRVRGGVIRETDMTLNPRKHRSIQAVESTFVHEMGHWVGITGHSESAASVMHLHTNDSNAEQVELDEEDIAQCMKANNIAKFAALN